MEGTNNKSNFGEKSDRRGYREMFVKRRGYRTTSNVSYGECGVQPSDTRSKGSPGQCPRRDHRGKAGVLNCISRPRGLKDGEENGDKEGGKVNV